MVTTREQIDIGALGWTTAGHADDGRVLSVNRLNLTLRSDVSRLDSELLLPC